MKSSALTAERSFRRWETAGLLREQDRQVRRQEEELHQAEQELRRQEGPGSSRLIRTDLIPEMGRKKRKNLQ